MGVLTLLTTTFKPYYPNTFVGTGTDVTNMFQEPSASNDGVGGLIDNLRVVAPYQEALAAVNLTKGSIYPWAISGGAGDKIYVALEMFPREPLPTFTYVSAEYASEVDALNLDGTQYSSLLASNEL